MLLERNHACTCCSEEKRLASHRSEGCALHEEQLLCETHKQLQKALGWHKNMKQWDMKQKRQMKLTQGIALLCHGCMVPSGRFSRTTLF